MNINKPDKVEELDRPNKKKMFIDFAKETAKLSRCKDGKVCAILVSADYSQIYTMGINGGPAGGKDCLCDLSHATEAKAKYSCVHAEMNCLVKNTCIDNVPKILICTKQPCAMCATLIVNVKTNIQKVIFCEPYWDNTGIEILMQAGIYVEHYSEVTK